MPETDDCNCRLIIKKYERTFGITKILPWLTLAGVALL